jgi:hypothetical protein
MTPGDVGSLPTAQWATTGQAPVVAKGLVTEGLGCAQLASSVVATRASSWVLGFGNVDTR